MSFSFNDFLAFVREDGLARQNRFFVQIIPPRNMSYLNDRTISLLCKSINVPGVNFATTAVRNYGEVFETPYDRNFSGATISFYTDSELYVKRYFDTWVTKIQDTNTRIMDYYENFISPTIHISILNKSDLQKYKIILHNAFPKTIGGLSLDNSVSDTMVFDVVFDYQYYVVEGTDSEVASGIYKPFTESSVFSLNNKFPLPTMDPAAMAAITNVPKMNDLNSIVNAGTNIVGIDAKAAVAGATGNVSQAIAAQLSVVAPPATAVPPTFAQQVFGQVQGVFDTTLNNAVNSMKYMATTTIQQAITGAISGQGVNLDLIKNSAGQVLTQSADSIVRGSVSSILTASTNASTQVMNSPQQVTTPSDQGVMNAAIGTVNNIATTSVSAAVNTVKSSAQSYINKSLGSLFG